MVTSSATNSMALARRVEEPSTASEAVVPCLTVQIKQTVFYFAAVCYSTSDIV